MFCKIEVIFLYCCFALVWLYILIINILYQQTLHGSNVIPIKELSLQEDNKS